MVVKYAKDNRYSEAGISTHDRSILKATAATVLQDIATEARHFNVIGIDEGQFFPDVVEFSEQMAKAGKTVIVAALDGTFQRKPFGRVLELVPLAESVVKLTAVCMNCANDAPFTKRLGAETAIEVIGGQESYMAACRECFDKVPETKSKIPTTPPPSPPRTSNLPPV
ncbi:thymidine kinase [Capsaspora owczarzaki ATCC 30864]|uniref:Thymidine kinase n=2 Tax=Capsaspora owczarzaki (strain ATCC 30864) TaxID=595528 RepID=A0A0D2WYI0_CAPO3|nr:thymidine kinase [Capsaspora owczarzaki ATCC 30864]